MHTQAVLALGTVVAAAELRETPRVAGGGGFSCERRETRKLLEEEAEMNH